MSNDDVHLQNVHSIGETMTQGMSGQKRIQILMDHAFPCNAKWLQLGTIRQKR